MMNDNEVKQNAGTANQYAIKLRKILKEYSDSAIKLFGQGKSIKSLSSIFKKAASKKLASFFVDSVLKVYNIKFERKKTELGLGTSHLKEFAPDLENFIKYNTSLITSITSEMQEKVQDIVARSLVDDGMDVPKEIRKVLKSSTTRARLIARDQASSIHGEINQLRMQSLKQDRYEWSTSADDRVRKTHKAKDGLVFEWSNPPADTGHPTKDILCRCVARMQFNTAAIDHQMTNGEALKKYNKDKKDINKRLASGSELKKEQHQVVQVLRGGSSIQEELYRGYKPKRDGVPIVGGEINTDTVASATKDFDRAKNSTVKTVLKLVNSVGIEVKPQDDKQDYILPDGVHGVVESIVDVNGVSVVTVLA